MNKANEILDILSLRERRKELYILSLNGYGLRILDGITNVLSAYHHHVRPFAPNTRPIDFIAQDIYVDIMLTIINCYSSDKYVSLANHEAKVGVEMAFSASTIEMPFLQPVQVAEELLRLKQLISEFYVYFYNEVIVKTNPPETKITREYDYTIFMSNSRLEIDALDIVIQKTSRDPDEDIPF